MIKYKRPSGTEIEVADTKANKETAESLGWKEVKEVIKAQDPKPRKAAQNGRNSKHSNS